MKKMLAIIMLAATIQSTYALFVHEVSAEKSDCAKPTEIVITALSASAITGSGDWVNQLQPGVSLTTNMIGTRKRTESVGGVTDEQYAQEQCMIESGEGIDHGKQVAVFDIKQIDDTQVEIKSEIELAESRIERDNELI